MAERIYVRTMSPSVGTMPRGRAASAVSANCTVPDQAPDAPPDAPIATKASCGFASRESATGCPKVRRRSTLRACSHGALHAPGRRPAETRRDSGHHRSNRRADTGRGSAARQPPPTAPPRTRGHRRIARTTIPSCRSPSSAPIRGTATVHGNPAPNHEGLRAASTRTSPKRCAHPGRISRKGGVRPNGRPGSAVERR